jgi:hypothetical protein
MNELPCADSTSYFPYTWVPSDTSKYTRINSDFLSSIFSRFNSLLDSLPLDRARHFKDFKFFISGHGLKHVIPLPTSTTTDSLYSACSFPYQYVQCLLQNHIDVSSIDPCSSWIDVAYCLKYTDINSDIPYTLLSRNYEELTKLFMCGEDISTGT